MQDLEFVDMKSGGPGGAALTPELASSWRDFCLSMPGHHREMLKRFDLTEDDVVADPHTTLGKILRLSAFRGRHGLPQKVCFGVVKGEIVAALNVRLELNKPLHDFGGHIGYSVKPNWRNKGVARTMLARARMMLPLLGLKRALLTTDRV